MRNLLTPVYHQIYLAGYEGHCPARWLRRLVAGTEMHRAWLSGYMGIYTDSRRRGVCDREGFRYRSSPRRVARA